MSNIKQVIVIRKDLNMRKGKMVAQGAHASMKVFFDRIRDWDRGDITIPLTDSMHEWVKGKFTKITVSVNSEAELDELYENAKSFGIPCAMIIDEGLTEFNGIRTKTALAIGPELSAVIDPLTYHLKLL